MKATATDSLRTMRLRWPLLAAALAAIVLLLWLKQRTGAEQRVGPAPPTPVLVGEARIQDLADTMDQIGTAQPWLGATVRAQISGRLVAVPVKEGAVVRQGELLA